MLVFKQLFTILKRAVQLVDVFASDIQINSSLIFAGEVVKIPT